MADLTADAVILKRIFSDDFNRVSIQGLGGAWSWYIYDSWPAKSSNATVMQVDGSAATIQSFIGDSFYESWVGFPLPLTGDLFFDFHVPATFSSSRPVYGFALDVVHYSGVYVTAWDSADWHVGTWKTADNFAIFTPTPSTWYRVHLRWTTERAYINVWKAADSEPAGWLYDETSAFDFAGDTIQPPFLDIYYSPTGPTVGKIDNIEIWTSQSQWTGFGGFFADAVLAPAFTANAVIAPMTVTANAVLQAPRSGSFTIDAFLIESSTRFTINAVLVAKETARLDAVIRKERRSYATRVIDDGASAYYKFDVEYGTLTAGYTLPAAVGPSGRLTSGYSYTGIQVSGGLQSAGPALGTGWLFRSSPNPPILFTPYAQKSSSKASVEGWIKTSQTSVFPIWDPYHWIDSIFHPGGGAGTGSGLGLSMGATGKIILRIEPNGTQIETTSTFNDNVWHHVVGVWDGTNGVVTDPAQFKIYVDGVEQSTTSSGTGLTAPLAGNPEGSLMAGWGYYGSKGQLIGGIDEVAFYNYTALSPTQVMDHYRAGFGVHMPDINARAVIRHPSFGAHSFSAAAYTVNPFRTQHPRDNTAHYDLDLDTFIVLAQALEVYPVGEDLHTVLTGILDRLDFLEGRSNDFPPEWAFNAAAVLFKPGIVGSLHVDALKSRSTGATLLVDAIVRRINAAGIEIDAIVWRSQASSFSLDAEVSGGGSTYSSSVAADAILMRGRAGSFTADVVLKKVISATMATDSVVRKAASASLTINAFVEPYFRADAVIAAAGGAFQSDTFQNNAFG